MRIPALAAALVIGAVALAGCSTTAKTGDGTATAAAASVNKLQIIVPADPGGGWDQTGRAVSAALTAGKLVSSAPVTNVSGAGGTVGLAKLATEKDPHTLMVTGLVMVGAVETNKSSNRMEDMTPIAKLTEEPLAVVVPAGSKYQTLKDLVDDVITNGQSVQITGGSAGGADQILAGLILEKAGLSGADIVSKLNYVPNSGGGEAVNLILGNKVAAGISGVGEFAEHVKSGKMRALAVSSDKPSTVLPDVKTITDAGYPVTLTNWRGVLAPKGISAGDKAALVKLVTDLHASTAWTDEVKKKGWADAFIPGDAFSTYLTGNISDVTKTLKTIGLI